jgi:pimeloyl-ACP methyl ester carboxylesterase
MSVATANGVSLAYELRGPPDGPPLVLVMGLGMPLALWPDAFVDGFAAEGFRVVLFDNRDAGWSQRIEAPPPGNPFVAIAKSLMGLAVRGVYTLEDMADDTAGLLDALGIARAHVVGMSMGGMIAQSLAARHPARVASLTSVMSSSGNARVSMGRPRAIRAILQPPPNPRDLASVARHLEHVLRVIGSRTHPADDALLKAICRRVAERGLDPRGAQRQLFAILASGDRRRDLARITAPTLVIHGNEDPLLKPAASRDIAAHVHGAKFFEIEGMGHDLPAPLIPGLVAMIASHCRAAGA